VTHQDLHIYTHSQKKKNKFYDIRPCE